LCNSSVERTITVRQNSPQQQTRNDFQPGCRESLKATVEAISKELRLKSETEEGS